MKKTLALLLAVIMAFSCAVPAFAASAVENIPTIMLRGDGNNIYKHDENGETPVWGDAVMDNIAGGNIGETVANILLPFLVEGLLQDEWDNYYQVFYDEISPIFDGLRLDGDGNPMYNTGISNADAAENAYKMNSNQVRSDGSFSIHSYTYWYDWRLDPLDFVDDFHTYITSVMRATKKDRVNLVANCLGGSFLLAYLEKYGDNGHIKNVFFNATVGNGTKLLTDAFTGNIKIDSDAIQRFGYQNVTIDSNSFAGFFASSPIINDLIFTSYDLLDELGVVDQMGLDFDLIYQKIYEGLVPRLAIAMFATMPGYWSTMEPGKYNEAIKFVFGQPGDELYEEYKGLIENRLNAYYNTVSSKKIDIIEKCKAKGVHFGAVAKYGVQMYPFVESGDQLSDELVDLENASFGATVADNIFAVLPDSHIKNAVEGGKYISPDKQVDASTSIFKDSLWIQKNVNHDTYLMDYQIIEQFCNHTGFTVYDDARYPQYMIYIPGTMYVDPETGEKDTYTGDIVPMTADNCNLTLWDEIPDGPEPEEPTVASRLMAFFRWIAAMIKFILGMSSEQPVL